LSLPAGKGFLAWFLRVSSDSDAVSTLQSYDLDGKPIKAHSDRGRNVTCLGFSSDGAMAATGDTQGAVRIFNVTAGERVRVDLPAHVKTLADLAITPDKKTLVTGDEDSEIKIWNIADRETLHTFQAHADRLTGIVLNPDGSNFATMARDGQVRLWDVKTGRQLREWNLHVPSRAFAFLPDGKNLLVANADATVYLLDLP
jgi:WD40 repeat protein